MVLSFGYDHENFISTLSTLDYLTRSSELLSLDAAFVLGPEFRSGLEARQTGTPTTPSNCRTIGWPAWGLSSRSARRTC